jgi:hypothetical protein
MSVAEAKHLKSLGEANAKLKKLTEARLDVSAYARDLVRLSYHTVLADAGLPQ